MTSYDSLFYVFAAVTIIPAIVTVFHPNILYAALSLFGSFFGVAGIYVLLGADFIAATQVLIYVGGILVLILFAVMLSKNIYGMTFQDEKKKKILPTLFGILLLGFLIKLITTVHWNTTLSEEGPLPTTAALGNLLLTEYLLPFELASVLLLAALIGAIILARSK
ncbi:MAG: hypothetical protein A2Z91_07055 [Deltaproteobacteria bacterium GWA2_38_16]|nr:MAG: hypothetical protein A2Z91_07055 [Deltaproteobacteria bacterium GWA2_38_16]OGQ02370.1 MAG: hypothetical protein A3D19_05970 [Deltaproteobacteria bacterium RIFCSPHIGHO2_02_FULL_38_15]OGQ34447.1 MAG: hypothetical protein A3A72_01050 [Deltaproteobacteria bacterium RIFCSPLOWO2_01_FULL_38_9]OGQ60441.1 MAG: hypothetical protein A3G92_07200 [Deltaproteobacteria bacterium RIFCSPLOWO2_12_FULL_38_8]HBQ20705.1 NADH-quinone oxidoreductase subunit J [Deltaproteobacteria bacterium]